MCHIYVCVCVCVCARVLVKCGAEFAFDLNPDGKNTHSSFHCSVSLSDAVWLKNTHIPYQHTYTTTHTLTHKQCRMQFHELFTPGKHISIRTRSIQRSGINLKLCFVCVGAAPRTHYEIRGNVRYAMCVSVCVGVCVGKCVE